MVAVCAVMAVVLVPNTNAGAEDMAAYDPHVQAALDVLDRYQSTSQLRAVLSSNQVEVHFVPMAAGVYARYSVARHVIEIDDRWADSDSFTLAAVIAHEATHAQDAVSGYLASGGAAACIDSEIRAFRTSALFWLAVFGPGGRPDATDELDRQLNSIADRELRDPRGLDDLVRQTYTQQCSH